MKSEKSTLINYSEELFGKVIKALVNKPGNEKILRKFKFDVFISYATEDIELADKVALACIQLGHIPYISHYDKDYKIHWETKANEVLKQVSFFFIIGTSSYIKEADKGGIGSECRTASTIHSIKKLGLDFTGDIKKIPGITGPMMWEPLNDLRPYTIRKLLEQTFQTAKEDASSAK